MKVSDILDNTRKIATPQFILKYWWLWCLLAILIFSMWTRSFPAKYEELQALDPFYAYRMNEYMLSHGLQLPTHDYMRYWPDGVPINRYGPLVYFYIPVIMYLVASFFGISMTYLNFAILYPAIMGTASVFIIFWIAKELFGDKKAALFSALFLATIPAYISRTSAGFFDKESTGGTFLLLALYFFLRSYNKKCWKSGLLSGVFTFIAMGSWGGAQFIIYIISAFLILKLLFNQYRESMLYSGVPVLISAFLTQHYFLGYVNISLEEALALFTAALILIRFSAERYRLVKKDQMSYLMPAIVVFCIIALLIGSIFSDFLWSIVDRMISIILIPEKGYIGSTVAEQMEGSWNDVTSRTSINFSGNLLNIGPPLDMFLSIWFLMIMGCISALYAIYVQRRWILMLPVLWLAMSVQTIFFMVRLVFFIGPPASLMAGFFVAYVISIFSGTEYMQKKDGLKKVNILSIALIAFVSLVIVANLATGYVFCSSLGPSFNQYWDEAMNYLSDQTPVNSSILSWWDFGYWFQTRGNRPSTADGGNINGSVNNQIADWYVSDSNNWTSFRPWLKGKEVDYILMDYTLPGKYGAISKIASRGSTVVGMLQFQFSKAYPQGNKTILEYTAGSYAVWLPVDKASGGIAGTPIFMVSSEGQYIGRNYINDICTMSGIVRVEGPEGGDTMPGCVALTDVLGSTFVPEVGSYMPASVFYVPSEAEFSIFTNLMFMNGYGIPDVEKVFDNHLIKIYKLEINETA